MIGERERRERGTEKRCSQLTGQKISEEISLILLIIYPLFVTESYPNIPHPYPTQNTAHSRTQQNGALWELQSQHTEHAHGKQNAKKQKNEEKKKQRGEEIFKILVTAGKPYRIKSILFPVFDIIF